MSPTRTQTWMLTRANSDEQSLFTLLKSIPPKRRPQAEFQAVIDEFRTRLETLNVAEADQFSVERYALPLADHYWSSQQPEEAKTVMRVYGAAVERMAVKTTMAALAVGWLSGSTNCTCDLK